MKDLFNRAVRASQSGSEMKLNVRQAERHIPAMFNGKATAYTGIHFQDGGLLEYTGSRRKRR